MGALLELGIPFFTIAAVMVLIGMSQAQSATKGTSGIAGWISWLAHGGPFAEIISLAAQAERWLISKFAATQIKLVSVWLTALSVLWGAYFKASAEVADATSRAVQALDNAVPRIARKEAAPALRQAKIAHRTATRAAAHATAVAHDLGHYKVRTNERLRHDAHAIDVTLPHDIARVRTREEALSRDQAKLKARTRSLEDGAVDTFDWLRAHPLSAVTGVFAGAVAVALSRIGFGFVRCRSWQNLGRSLTCGMGQWLLDALKLLSAFALGLLSVLDPEAEAKAAVAAVDALEPILSEILSK